jgi:isopropylmalate/homocitrate/citramalate synthase
MLRFDKHTNTLMEEVYRYQLQDVPQPELFRDFFPYNEVPRIVFNHRRVPMQPPDEIWITDTTFRDGQQARPPYSVKQIVDIYSMLHRLGGHHGLIRQCEFFLYSEKDREAVAKCLELGYRYPEVTGWIRAVKKDFQLVKQMGLTETGILTSCSDYHIFLKLKKTRAQAIEMYLDVVRAALEQGITIRCHLEDITRADFYGFVLPFVQKLEELSEEADIPIKIRACDTMGYGVPYPGAALPRSVPGIIYGLRVFGGVPAERIEWHGHNDFHKVLVNAATAWLYGCAAANGALFGIGERTGNPPLEGLVMEYLGLRGSLPGVDTTVITELAEYFEREMGVTIPDNYPFVGKNFNVTAAGIHADGLMKNEEIYNPFDTVSILNRPPGVAVTDKSGAAGIVHWIHANFPAARETVAKTDPAVAAVNDWVETQYAEGRTTQISPDEMLDQVRLHFPHLVR